MVKNQFNITLSPGTVYPVFRKLEAEKNIKRLIGKSSGIYILTSKGKQNIEYFNANVVFFRLLAVY